MSLKLHEDSLTYFSFAHFQKSFAHFSNILPSWGPKCPDGSSFCPLSGQEQGCFRVGLWLFVYVHIPKRVVCLLSKEQGLGWYSEQNETPSGQNETHLGHLYEKWAKVL